MFKQRRTACLEGKYEHIAMLWFKEIDWFDIRENSVHIGLVGQDGRLSAGVYCDRVSMSTDGDITLHRPELED